MICGVQGRPFFVRLWQDSHSLRHLSNRRLYPQSRQRPAKNALDPRVEGIVSFPLWSPPPHSALIVSFQFAGVSNTSKLYTRGIRVCTGTGIGAALATCLQSPYWCVQLQPSHASSGPDARLLIVPPPRIRYLIWIGESFCLSSESLIEERKDGLYICGHWKPGLDADAPVPVRSQVRISRRPSGLPLAG